MKECSVLVPFTWFVERSHGDYIYVTPTHPYRRFISAALRIVSYRVLPVSRLDSLRDNQRYLTGTYTGMCLVLI